MVTCYANFIAARRNELQHCAQKPRNPGMSDNHQREELRVAQLYLQRFEYRAATKSEFDQAWAMALQTFARTGNWGNAEAGIRHIKSYGTAWGGYVLFEVDDADAFGRYQ